MIVLTQLGGLMDFPALVFIEPEMNKKSRSKMDDDAGRPPGMVYNWNVS